MNVKRASIVVALIAAAVAAGCKGKNNPPPLEESLARYGPEVSVRLARLQAIAPTLDAAFAGSPTTKLPRGKLHVVESWKPQPGQTTTLVMDRDIAHLTTFRRDRYRPAQAGLLPMCAAIVDKQTSWHDEAGNAISLQPWHAAEYLPLCAALDYVVIVKITKTGAAGVPDPGARTFLGGSSAGKALVYDLHDGGLLGGFGFEAKSESSIAVTSGRSADDQVDADLVGRTISKLFAGIDAFGS